MESIALIDPDRPILNECTGRNPAQVLLLSGAIPELNGNFGNWNGLPLRAKIVSSMTPEDIAQLRAKAGWLYQRAKQLAVGVPAKAWVVFGLFLFAALLMAIHTALTAKDASLHLKLQHGFRNAQISLWVDGDLAFSGKVTGSTKKKFGVIPTDAVQGSLSQIIPLRSGRHNVRLRIEPEDSAAQEDTINGDFGHNAERDLVVSARRSSVSLAWQRTGNAPVETFSPFAWFARYAGSLFLTIAGSIMSALAGYAIRELPARLSSTSDATAKAELGVNSSRSQLAQSEE